MSLNTSCPHCGKKYQLLDKLAGRTVRCKSCQKEFTVKAEEPDGEMELVAGSAAVALSSPRVPVAAKSLFEPTPPAPLKAQAMKLLLGPIDATFWISVGVSLLLISGLIFPSLQWFATAITILTAVAMLLAGTFWAAKIMIEEGLSFFWILTLFFRPVLFVGMFYASILEKLEVYGQALYCQFRGILLIVLFLVIAHIASCQSDAAAERQRVPNNGPQHAAQGHQNANPQPAAGAAPQ